VELFEPLEFVKLSCRARCVGASRSSRITAKPSPNGPFLPVMRLDAVGAAAGPAASSAGVIPTGMGRLRFGRRRLLFAHSAASAALADSPMLCCGSFTALRAEPRRRRRAVESVDHLHLLTKPCVERRIA